MRIRAAAIAAVLLLGVTTLPAGSSHRCDVQQVYEIEEEIPEMKVLTKDGEIVQLDELVAAVLVPAKLRSDSYDVEVSRLGQNVYEVHGRDLIVESRYCSRYAQHASAILDYRSTSGWSKGDLVFEK